MSLLLSKEAPRAEASISPFLKSAVPTGSLDFDRSQASQPTQAQEEQIKTVATGWNLTSLNSAADKLLGAAQRLEKEMEKETKYWNQILSVSQKGWSTCRMPRERHTVGVRFGFSEAAPVFSGRGLAALRPDAGGDIVLDQGLSATGNILLVKVVKNDRTLQVSRLPAQQFQDVELETLIHQARDSLFDEELFYEITREARTLISWGVVVDENSVRLPLDTSYFTSDTISSIGREVILELVPRDAMPAENQRASEADADADAIALALRLLLADVHRQRFARRARPPAPLTDEKLKTPTHDILQTLMNCLCHSHCVTAITQQLLLVRLFLGKAGFPSTHVRSTQHDIHFEMESTTSSSMGDSVVSRLRKPLRTIITWGNSGLGRQTLKITSQMAPPTFGTTFKLEIEDSNSKSSELEAHSLRDIQQTITKNIIKSLYQHILRGCPDWVRDDSTGGLRRKVPGGSRKSIDRITLSLEAHRLAMDRVFEDSSTGRLLNWAGKGKSAPLGLVDAVKALSFELAV